MYLFIIYLLSMIQLLVLVFGGMGMCEYSYLFRNTIFALVKMLLLFTVSKWPKLACQKCIIYFKPSTEFVCLYVSLSSIAGAEGVNVEVLMCKIGLTSCLNYFRIVSIGVGLAAPIGVLNWDHS